MAEPRPYETRTVAATVELRDEDAAPTLTGYAATFNEPYQIGYFRERIHPDAFKRTLAGAPDVRLLIDHEGQPLARTKSGTLTLAADSRGLQVRATLDPSDPDVQRLLPKMRRGDLDQMSFAFRVPAGGDTWDYSGDVPDRTIREANLSGGDVSVVTYPANEATEAQVRARDERESAYVLADALLRELRQGRRVDSVLLSKTMGALGVPDLQLQRQSFNDTENALRDALQAKFGGDDGDECCDLWVQDASTDWVVFTSYGDAGPGRGTWQMTYTTDEAGAVTLTGDPVKVTSHTTYTPVDQQNSMPLDLARRLQQAAELRRLSA